MRVSRVDVAVLGCLLEAPSHGYDLVAAMRLRGMDRWGAVGRASVYQALPRLEGSGDVTGRRSEGAEGPDRRVYRATPAGRRRFVEGVTERLQASAPSDPDAALGLAFLHLLPAAARRAGIEARARALWVVAGTAETDGDPMRARERALAQAELDWLRTLEGRRKGVRDRP